MWPPPAVQVSASTLRAVVLPAPAGAMTSWTRRRSVASVRTICACPASSAVPSAVGLGEPEVDRDGLQGLPVGQVSGVQESLLSGEDPGRGVLGRCRRR